MFGGYTCYSVEGANGESIPNFEPDRMVRLFTNYRFSGGLENLSIGAGARWQGNATGLGYDFNYENVEVSQGGYTLFDLTASYRVVPQWELSASVSNVTDKEYYSNLGGALNGAYYGEPRTVTVAVSWHP